MRKIRRWLNDLFSPGDFNNLDMDSIASAFNDPGVRVLWLEFCSDELKRINMDVDKRLLLGSEIGLTDLCARRKAFQDVLEAVLIARRRIGQEVRHNPRVPVAIDLDRVTV